MSDPVARLGGLEGRGPLWGTASEEVNATLLAWPAGEATPEHVNAERDVLIVVMAGGGTVTVDGVAHEVAAEDALLVSKGAARSVTAGPEGIRYLSVHLRRTLGITRS